MELDERYNTFDGSVHTNMKGNGENGTRWVEERLIIEVAVEYSSLPTRRSTVPGPTNQGLRGTLQ